MGGLGIGKRIDDILSSKVKFIRACILLGIIGLFSFLILTDQTCDWRHLVFGTKSKVNVDIKKGG